MTTGIRKIMAGILCAGTATAAPAAKPAAEAADAPVYDVAVNVDETAGTLTVDVELRPSDFSVKRDGEIILTPVVYSASGTDSLELEPANICGRNRWYYYLRNGEIDGDDTGLYRRADSNGSIHLKQTVPFEPWMQASTVELRQEAATCCRTPQTAPGTSDNGNTELARIDTRRPELIEEYVFAPPVDNKPVIATLEGKAFVSFVVNRTELKEDYMVNRREIAKIINSIDHVRNDSDAVITDIHIKGFASPEGSYSNNIRLAKGRTATLSEYVRDYCSRYFNLDNSIVSNSFEPEDWQGLRSYVADSLGFDIKHRDEIIAMIDSPTDPDVKNELIRRTYPDDYKVLHKEIYPWLRHSDYTVKYRIKVYTDPATLLRLYRSDATRLRPVDFYTVAGLYEEGSPEFISVMRKAVEVYPDDPMLNLNAASIALIENNTDLAAVHLAKAGDSPEATFARGVTAARRGHLDEATGYFRTAQKAGIAKAGDYLANIEAIKNHTAVSITARTEKSKETKQEKQ